MPTYVVGNGYRLEVPRQARVILVEIVTSTLTRSWGEVIERGAPHTPQDSEARGVEKFFTPKAPTQEKEILLLLNFTRRRPEGWLEMKAWSRENRLRSVDPRWVLALGEQHPRLNEELLGQGLCYVAATSCLHFMGLREAFLLVYALKKRIAKTSSLEKLGFLYDWFVFRVPRPKVALTP